MTGHSNPKITLAQVVWADAEIQRIDMDYDDLSFLVLDGSGRLKRVICEGHLGFELAGFWDEMIVDFAELRESGAFLDRCLANISRRLGQSPLPSGNEVRNGRNAMQLVVTLIDGCELIVAMKGLRVELV